MRCKVLTEADQDRIRALVEKGWKIGRIARAISRNHDTVYWFMLRNGLVERRAGNRKDTPYKRAGRWVYPYSLAEDEFIERLRTQGLDLKAVAEQATERFGKPRNHHSIFVRLTFLAATA